MNNVPWPVRIVPPVVWKAVFWFVRNAAGAARMGWDAAGGQVSIQKSTGARILG